MLQGYAQQGFNAWHKKWQSYDALYGQEVEVLGLAQAITGTAQGIDKQGAFIINTATGLQFISGGEVSLRKKEH
ncbi:MAG: hypothetical protein IPL02_09385 [Moraxellaceae bacterium]|nr:hypothetical protein [Moraxellaceae bacterium]